MGRTMRGGETITASNNFTKKGANSFFSSSRILLEENSNTTVGNFVNCLKMIGQLVEQQHRSQNEVEERKGGEESTNPKKRIATEKKVTPETITIQIDLISSEFHLPRAQLVLEYLLSCYPNLLLGATSEYVIEVVVHPVPAPTPLPSPEDVGINAETMQQRIQGELRLVRGIEKLISRHLPDALGMSPVFEDKERKVYSISKEDRQFLEKRKEAVCQALLQIAG